jgi:uncharacterized protein (TIGR02246 family)
MIVVQKLRYFFGLARIGAFLVVLAAGPAGSLKAEASRCAPVSEASVEMLFDLWAAALAAGDPARVAGRYAADALLFPTSSDRPRMGRAAIEGYFAEFLGGRPSSVVERRAIFLGCNTAVDAGIYTIMVDGDAPEERVPLRARFSFVYELREGRWLITHHHSSSVPGAMDRHSYIEPWSASSQGPSQPSNRRLDDEIAISWP